MTVGLLLVSLFTFVELNCENLFDCRHDSLKNDVEFLPEGRYRWTPSRYWEKLNHVGQTIVSCGDSQEGWSAPALVALCEVENDSVLHDLTRRSLLRKARYDYVMTSSPDERGIDVALLYSPYSFALLNWRPVRIPPVDGMRPTRDLIYASGIVEGGDTLHVIVLHFPSRRGGEHRSRPFREQAARTLCGVIDSVRAVSSAANIVVAGDFNDYSQSPSVRMITSQGLLDVSVDARGSHGAKGTYRYLGSWGSLDHILLSPGLAARVSECFIHDAPFLLEEDTTYGGVKPFRTFLGPRYRGGFSDHLPLVVRWTVP